MDIAENVKELVDEFSERYVNLLIQKKTVDQDIKALKQEFDEQGLPTKIVIKAINNIKREKKADESELFEMDKFKTWLEENKKFIDSLTEIIS